MKSHKFKTLTVLLAAAVCFIKLPISHVETNVCTDKSAIYRLHIIANSDSYEDQQIKLRVRDAVLDFEKKLFDKKGMAESAHEAKTLLMENACGIYETAENVILQNGADYGVKLSTGIYNFPDRTYKDVKYPEGDYNALRIVLGDGEGKNWWCVMFPPLCIIDDTDGKIESEEALENEITEYESILVKFFRWLKGLFD